MIDYYDHDDRDPDDDDYQRIMMMMILTMVKVAELMENGQMASELRESHLYHTTVWYYHTTKATTVFSSTIETTVPLYERTEQL